ncbi:GDSL-type esterase/lipase family protein [Saprospiraceae bacterium]|nr:GDSL-type esterase/lipase family protein [Saprospiraceae bacterium]
MGKISLALLIVIFTVKNLSAQNPLRFEEEIKIISEISISQGEKVSVFTGSSSIRLWKGLNNDCHEMKVINTGFGGSQMSDLLYFLDQTVLRFRPSKVYIYEGDNDIVADKDPRSIILTAELITSKILESNPNTIIYFISAKPSPSRWEYKKEYIKFNSLLKDYCETNNQLFFIDIWNPMLDVNLRPQPQIFISDSLHMNRQGYLLWKDIICK